MSTWVGLLRGDPLPWLLDGAAPAVRHLALRDLLGRTAADPDLAEARRDAMSAQPIAGILARQEPEGWWVKPGPGYSPKYTGTVWQVMFLEQMGADGSDPRVARACDYVLSHAQTAGGGFGASGAAAAASPPPSSALTCLNGNLLRALIGLGRLEDERVGRAIAWQAGAITGEDVTFHRSGISGPGFCCAANEHLPCGWAAVKAVLGLAAIPEERRSDHVRRALVAGVEFLLGCDPSTAAYPMGWGNTKPSGSWFRLGFPSGYVADVLQTMEAACAAGLAADPRLDHAVDWLLCQQDEQGRWANRYAYQGKLIADIDRPGVPSRWVTLRACRVLKAVAEARSRPAAS